MATNTYTALKTVTVSGTSASYIDLDLTGLTAGYTHIDLVGYLLKTTSGDGTVRINVGDASLDTGSSYSSQIFYGNGSQGYADYSGANITYGRVAGWSGSSSGNTLDVRINYFQNTNFFKVIQGEGGNSAGSTNVAETLWRSTSPINIIRISADGGNFDVGSTITVYGIAAEGASPAPKATGGVIYSDSTYYYHVFPSTGVFTPTQSITADVLVVSGGGSGTTGQSGTYYGFGGGAGQVSLFSSQSLTTTNYACTVGGGGPSISSIDNNGNAGTGSQFAGLTLGTGGGGALFSSRGGNSGNGFTGGTGIPTACGGGAGAGQNGFAAASSSSPGAGGNGTSTYSSWLEVIGLGENVSGTWYIGGGGGGVYASVIAAGGYGGANAYYNGATSGGGGQANKDGNINTGSGGSGGGDTAGASGKGGSGVIVVRYVKA